MSASDFQFELDPQLSAEEFAFELEPIESLTAGDSDNPHEGSEHSRTDGDVPAARVAALQPQRPSGDKSTGHEQGDQGAERPAVKDNPEPAALMQVLPADFPLPSLIKFCPDPALRDAADQAAKYALSLEVREVEGVQRADVACTALRASLKAIDGHFEEPADISNRLHKQITGTRAEWTANAKAALQTVGGRVATELRRLQAEAQERTRKAQEQEDRKARERAREEAAAAAKANVPAPVVEQLRQQAEVATAPPVAIAAPAPTLAGSTPVGTWKPRLKGTSGEAQPLPSMDALTPGQREQVNTLLRAILDGAAPYQCIAWGETYLSKRAKADKSTLDIPGIEAFEDLGIRGKAQRGSR